MARASVAPAAFGSWAAVAAFASFRSAMTTRAPSRAKRLAVASPIPLAAPVTMTDLLRRFILTSCHLSVARLGGCGALLFDRGGSPPLRPFFSELVRCQRAYAGTPVTR